MAKIIPLPTPKNPWGESILKTYTAYQREMSELFLVRYCEIRRKREKTAAEVRLLQGGIKRN